MTLKTKETRNKTAFKKHTKMSVSAVLAATSLVGLVQPVQAAEERQVTNQEQKVKEETDRLIVELEAENINKQEVSQKASEKITEIPSVDNSTSTELVKDKVAGDEASIVIETSEELSKDEQAQAIEKLKALPEVKEVYPDKLVMNATEAVNSYSSNSDANTQWGIANAAASTAWRAGLTGAGSTVAIVDTGSKWNFDLAGQEVQGYDFVSGAYLSNDGDGRDSNPADVAANTGNHGQFVSGVISAKSNNAGITGVAPDSKFFHARALGTNTGGYQSDIADAITYSAGGKVAGAPVRTPASVINLSLGWTESCPAYIQKAISYAVSRNVPVVTAAGNFAIDANRFTPANCNGTISVGAIGSNNSLASFSNWGSGVDLVAPGVSIASTTNNSIGYKSGTSFAAPHVAGAIALMKEANPNLTEAEVRTILLNTADRTHQGYKKLNAGRAATEAKKTATPIVYGGIGAYYWANGGTSKFGQPITQEYDTTNGRAQDFSNGYSIIWSERTGAYPMFNRGAIAGKWYAADKVRGYGFPVNAEHGFWEGARQSFYSLSKGSRTIIYWSPQYGAKALNEWGAIYGKWANEGDVKTYGFPTTDEYSMPNGGYAVKFKKGNYEQIIVWSADKGTHALNANGAIYWAWKGNGYTTGLGFPVTDEFYNPATKKVEIHFSKGKKITWTEAEGARIVNL